MSGKSVLNELYQRLRTAAPVYATQVDGQNQDGFVCDLTLPAVDAEGLEPLRAARAFSGRGTTKKVRAQTLALLSLLLYACLLPCCVTACCY
jgi:hypothetical protein